MTVWQIPWLELSIAMASLGAMTCGQLRRPFRAWLVGLMFNAATLTCAVLASASFYVARAADATSPPIGSSWRLIDESILSLDELSAPLFPLLGLLHFLMALATGRTKMRRFSSSWSLASEAVRLSVFSCRDAAVLVGLLILGGVIAGIELLNRGRSIRVFAFHMGLFSVLLVLGLWSMPEVGDGSEQAIWSSYCLFTAILIRCGTIPFHCWVTDWLENASFGNAVLFLAPLKGVYAAMRLVLPIAPDWMLQAIGLFSLLTCVYTAALAIGQSDPRRFYAYLFLSHAASVLVGLELHTPVSLTGSLALWISVSLSLAGFGLVLRALEARVGRLSLNRFHGLYDQSPSLAVAFLVTGLASVGFPGTLGFIAAEVLVDGAISANVFVGVALVGAAALNGIAVVRAYFALFTGTRHVSAVPLGITPRERFAVLTLLALILGGGLFPQPGILSRYRAARELLQERQGMKFASPRNDRPTNQPTNEPSKPRRD